MRLISSHLAVPLIFGISLTGVCVGLFYFLYKKDEEEAKDTITFRAVKKNVVQELKISRQFVPAVIGRGGATIKDIEERSATRIRFNDDNPEEPERICRIKGDYEAIKLAEAMIQNVIADVPIIETYEMFIPQRVQTMLIENRGELINTIQSSSNTKIILEKGYRSDPDTQRRVIIKGTAEKIAEVVSCIEDLVREAKIAVERLKIGQSTRSPRGRVTRNTVINNINNNNNNGSGLIQQKQQPVESPSPSPIARDGIMEVYVSAADTPSRFWVQAVGAGTHDLDELVKDMTDYYNNDENRGIHLLRNISVGQTVAAKFSFDNCWYRAEVTDIIGNGLYSIYFVDYGDQEVVEAKDILELRTDFLSLRLQAIECCLANVKPKREDWSQEACDRFADLSWVAQWKILIAKVRGYKERVISQGKSRREGSPIPCVDLFDNNDNQNIDIGKQLIIEDLASNDETTWSASTSILSPSKRNNNDFLTSTTMSHDSVGNTISSSISSPEMTPPHQLKPAANIESLQLKPDYDLIDLTTPKKTVIKSKKVIEEIDLVTPKHERTKKFIDVEKDSHENGIEKKYEEDFPSVGNNNHNIKKQVSSILPAGEESDDDDSDCMEMG